MQDVPHAHGARVRQQDEPQVCRRLVEVQLVVGRAVAYEGIVVTAELAHHVAQGEDGAEDELCVVRGIGASGIGVVREPGACVYAFSCNGYQ